MSSSSIDIGSIPASATRAAIEIVRGAEGSDRRRHLGVLAERLHQGPIGGDRRSPIAPWIIGSDGEAMERSKVLLADGILAQGIRPPTVPEGTARIRFGLTAGHSVEQVERVLAHVPRETRST